MSSLEYGSKSRLVDTFLERSVERLRNDYVSLREISVANKEFLYRQGDHCADVFWIKSGVVKLSHLATQGTEITIAFLRKGDVIGFLGEHAEYHVMEESAQAVGDVNFYRLTCEDFKALLSQHAELAWY